MSDLDKITISWSEVWSVNSDGTPKTLIAKGEPTYSSEELGVSYSEWDDIGSQERMFIEDETEHSPVEP